MILQIAACHFAFDQFLIVVVIRFKTQCDEIEAVRLVRRRITTMIVAGRNIYFSHFESSR